MQALPQSVRKAEEEANRLQTVRMSDENKHQYVSCIGAQGGAMGALAILAAGIYKEGKDLAKKLPSKAERQRYNGTMGVIKDSVKDLKNDLYGAGYGLMYRDLGDCDFILKRKIK